MKCLIGAFVLLLAAVVSSKEMPEIVARGKRPDVRPCKDCHLSNGFGRPGNASLAGLPAEYISEQMANYRKGLRGSANARTQPSAVMQAIAKAADEADLRAAAEYFASIELRPWTRVVEAATVPATGDDGPEPIGRRIVEVPEDRGPGRPNAAAFGFVAYVPVGSISKGQELVTSGGGGRTMRCAQCHGGDLRGAGRVPPIAGRSPSYVARQLTDMRAGTRRGVGPDLMMAAVARLTEDDFVAIAAYTASLAP